MNKKIEYQSLFNEAIKLSQMFPIYPLAPFTNIPLRGSRGELDATQDQRIIEKWFEKEPMLSIGLSLKETGIFVLDVDDHSGNGLGLNELSEIARENSIENETVVMTPTGKGFHVYFRIPEGITLDKDIRLTKNIEILTKKVTASGSRKRIHDGTIGVYNLVSGSFSDIKIAPQWLLKKIMSKQQEFENSPEILDLDCRGQPKLYYTARFINELLEGAEKGNRNQWITSQVGKLIGLGMEYTAVYRFIKIINNNCVMPPLKDKELNSIVVSIAKREQKKITPNGRSD